VTAFFAVASSGSAQESAPDVELVPDPALVCAQCEAWNQPHAPFRVYGNTYYVGTALLSSILIATDDGLVLIDGALPQSAPLIAENIRALGFRVADIKLILSSHIHHDHAGGIAALARASGARIAVSAPAAEALALGHATEDDPQYGYVSAATTYVPVTDVEVIADGQTLTVGDVTLTAHLTPGHTPGGTTWSWRACEDDACVDVVYADSLTAVSDDDFRFTGDAEHPSRVESFRASIAAVAALPCDILLSPHPGFFQMEQKLTARDADSSTNPFIEPGACAAYAAAASEGLERRIAAEGAGQGN
jgi:metallo-beta-lactamase class B